MEKINPTKQDYQMLSMLIEKGIEVLKECNIKAVDGCHYDFHTKKAMGMAYPSKKKITINYYFFKACIKNNRFHELENTMIHEMLHLVASQIDPKAGHTGIWKQLALKVSHKTDYNITRLASVEKVALKNTMKPPKYTVVCTECGKEYYYQRDCRAIEYIKSNMPFVSCSKCHGKLKIK